MSRNLGMAESLTLDDELIERLAATRAQSLYRRLSEITSAQGTRVEIDGREFLNFSSNDYLGLAAHSDLKAAAIKAVQQYGTGSGASRLICGSLAPHHELERELAAYKQTEAALTFSSGYAAAVGTIGALVGKDDMVILDRLVHACIVDAARLSGAKLCVFGHNDLDALARILARSQANHSLRRRRVLIVTESVFSMDGDLALLREIVELKEKHGAWLMVDEAHATGVVGPVGRGLAAHLNAAGQIEVQMGTLGKALGSAGGYICGSQVLIDFLVNRARSFIFSTAPVPAAAAAARQAVALMPTAQAENWRRVLEERLTQLRTALFELQTSICPALKQLPQLEPNAPSAIVPFYVGDERRGAAHSRFFRPGNPISNGSKRRSAFADHAYGPPHANGCESSVVCIG